MSKSEQDVRKVIEWLEHVPDIPKDKRGITFTSKCSCGGTITAVRSTYNGHLQAKCDKCQMSMIE